MNPIILQAVLIPAEAGITADELRSIPSQILGLLQEWGFYLILAATVVAAFVLFFKTHSFILVGTVIFVGIVLAGVIWRIDSIAAGAPDKAIEVVTGADKAEAPNAPAQAPAERPAGS